MNERRSSFFRRTCGPAIRLPGGILRRGGGGLNYRWSLVGWLDSRLASARLISFLWPFQSELESTCELEVFALLDYENDLLLGLSVHTLKSKRRDYIAMPVSELGSHPNASTSRTHDKHCFNDLDQFRISLHYLSLHGVPRQASTSKSALHHCGCYKNHTQDSSHIELIAMFLRWQTRDWFELVGWLMNIWRLAIRDVFCLLVVCRDWENIVLTPNGECSLGHYLSGV